MTPLNTLDRPTTTAADPITDARNRILGYYTGTLDGVTVPDGWSLERIGQAWSVGPSGSGTHLLVDDLWQIPGAIRTFEQALRRAAGIGGIR